MNGVVTQYWSIIPGGIYQVLYEPITGVDRFNVLSICRASAKLPASQSTAPHFPSSLDRIRNRKAQTGLVRQSSLIELHPQNRTRPHFGM